MQTTIKVHVVGNLCVFESFFLQLVATVNRQIADSVSGITNSGLLVLVALQSRQTIKCLHGVACCFQFVFFLGPLNLCQQSAAFRWHQQPHSGASASTFLWSSPTHLQTYIQTVMCIMLVVFGLFCMFMSTISRNCKVDQQV